VDHAAGVGPSRSRPDWPLPGKPSVRERALWVRMWRKPQAIMWERAGQELDVAVYCRRFAESERREAPVTGSVLVKQLSDSLGLSQPGLRSLRWKISADEVTERRQAARPAAGASARERLAAVRDATEG
jgi:hypothetical protein